VADVIGAASLLISEAALVELTTRAVGSSDDETAGEVGSSPDEAAGEEDS
jgi:hypothetical protein